MFNKRNNSSDKLLRDWKMPVMTENGVIGGSKFACTSAPGSSINEPVRAPWTLFTYTADYNWHHEDCNGNTWIKIYNPFPLLLNKISYYNSIVGNNKYGTYDRDGHMLTFDLMYSDDDVTYTLARNCSTIKLTEEWYEFIYPMNTWVDFEIDSDVVGAHKYWKMVCTDMSKFGVYYKYDDYSAIGFIVYGKELI